MILMKKGTVPAGTSRQQVLNYIAHRDRENLLRSAAAKKTDSLAAHMILTKVEGFDPKLFVYINSSRWNLDGTH